MGKLTAVAVKAAIPTPGNYQDGDGLILKVDKRGGACWLLRLQHDDKRQDIGLGSAKVLSLAEAREKAGGYRKAVKIERRDVLAENKMRLPPKRRSARRRANITARTKRAGKAPCTRASGSLVWKTMLSRSWANYRPAESPPPTSSRC